MPLSPEASESRSNSRRAAKVLEKRGKYDLTVLEMNRKYEGSLELAAKKCVEALRQVESVSFGHKDIPQMLAEAKKSIILSINMIVRAGLTDQRKKAYVTKKDRNRNEILISERKKLEDDHFFDYKRADNDFDVSCQPSTG